MDSFKVLLFPFYDQTILVYTLVHTAVDYHQKQFLDYYISFKGVRASKTCSSACQETSVCRNSPWISYQDIPGFPQNRPFQYGHLCDLVSSSPIHFILASTKVMTLEILTRIKQFYKCNIKWLLFYFECAFCYYYRIFVYISLGTF